MAKLNLKRLVRMEKGLASPYRLRILAMLQGGPLCVSQVTAALHLSPASVSTHLGELRNAGLVEDERRGRFVWYRISPDTDTCQLVTEALGHLERDGEVRQDQVQVTRERGKGGLAARPRVRYRGTEDAAKGDLP